MTAQLVQLSKLSELITKGTTPTSLGFDFVDTGIRFLRVQNIFGGRVNHEAETLFITPSTHVALKRSQIRAKDVLVTIAGTIGRTGVVPDDVPDLNCNQAVAIVRTNSAVDRFYLCHWLQSNDAKAQMIGSTVTGTISNLSLTQLGELKIPLPPLLEQRRIAAILDQAETLRTQRRTALTLLDTLNQSIFLDMFGDSRANPKGSPTLGINTVCELIVDCVNRTAPLADSPTQYKMIRTTNVKSGKVDISNVRFVTLETFKVWNRRATPKRGDVLLTREAPLGEAGILDSDDNVFLGQRMMLYRPNKTLVTSEYLLHSFLSGFLQDQFDRHGSGSTVKHLSLPACRAFELRVPPLPLQQTFATRITAIEALKSTHRAALAQLDALFASLQHRAFSGTL